MRLLIVFILALLCVTPARLNAQEKSLHYIWNRKGVPVYTAPSAEIALDTVSYGTAVHTTEVGSEVVAQPLSTYASGTATKVYKSPSKWLLIEGGNRPRGYVLNTCLLEFPTNLTARMID